MATTRYTAACQQLHCIFGLAMVHLFSIIVDNSKWGTPQLGEVFSSNQKGNEILNRKATRTKWKATMVEESFAKEKTWISKIGHDNRATSMAFSQIFWVQCPTFSTVYNIMWWYQMDSTTQSSHFPQLAACKHKDWLICFENLDTCTWYLLMPEHVLIQTIVLLV